MPTGSPSTNTPIPSYTTKHGNDLPLIDIDVLESTIVSLINNARSIGNLESLVRASSLDDLATAHSRSMADSQRTEARSPDTGCGSSGTHVVQWPQVKSFSYRGPATAPTTITPTEYDETAKETAGGVVEYVHRDEAPYTKDPHYRYVGVGAIQSPDEHGFMVFWITLYLADCIAEVPTATGTATATPHPSPTLVGAVATTVTNALAVMATPSLTSTHSPSPTPTNTPVPTATPTHTPSPTPTNTPVPVVRLALDAKSTVVGYWSDGTADVEVTATLRNDGTLKLDRAQDIRATCIAEGDERRACREEVSLSLQDGFAPSSENFSLRLPMGMTTMTFDYGGAESLTFDVEVPERILGVDREVWECYADRPQERTEIEGESFDGCGGWSTRTVEKWLNDVPVKVWATGDATHIATLETVLMELAPILDLEFEWVDSEEEADFKAFVGVPRSDALTLDIVREFPSLVHAWGFASANVKGGEATSGYMVIWDSDLTRFRSPIDSIRSVTIHEALHALVPISHSTRPVSIMGGSGLNTWSPMDARLIELNSHPLVRPGMSMDDVREVIVLTDEFLDYQQAEPDGTPVDPLDLVWRAYVALEEAGSASFRVSGGECSHTFGMKRSPIELSIGEFRVFKDDPALLYLNIHPGQFYVAYSRTDKEWTHWQLSSQGIWEKVDRGTVADSSSWWLWNGKLHRAIRSVLMDGSSEEISVDETADGNLRLQVTLDESYVNMWDWTGRDSLDLTLVLDPETYTIVGYTWEMYKKLGANPDACLTYMEVATDGRLGVDIGTLLDEPRTESYETSGDPFDLVWQVYVALEEAGSASFRLSGGWIDRACNHTFGVRRGPIEMSIGDFSQFKDNPALSYLDMHTSQFYIIYSRTNQEWTHWKLSPEGTWQRVDHETIADASSWWVWNGKLHAAIRNVLMDGSPENITVNEEADGNLRIEATHVNMGRNLSNWTQGDSFDLTLVVDPETYTIVGYTWEMHKNPGANPGVCLIYKETATDGRLGVEITVPEVIRNELAAMQ